MLLSFQFSNFKSFRDTQYFSMLQKHNIAANDSEDDSNAQVMHVAAIYGANAAGKTSVLEAIDALRTVVRNSDTNKDGFASYQFTGNSDNDSEFKVKFITGKHQYKYAYELKFNSKAITYESLLVYKSSHPSTLFERSYDKEIHSGQLKKMTAVISSDQKSAIPYFLKTKSDITLLNFLNSIDAEKDDVDEYIHDAYEFLAENIIYKAANGDVESFIDRIPGLMQQHSDSGEWLNLLLPAADFGIQSVRSVEDKSDETEIYLKQREILNKAIKEAIKLRNPELTDDETDKQFSATMRQAFKLIFDHNINGQHVNFSPGQESRGTLAATVIFLHIAPILSLGATYIVDELDCSLHPMLVAQIVEVFKNPDTNPYGAQLIFTTHDISLLDKAIYGEDILSRGEVWFVEKNQEGISTLYPLTDIKNTTRKEDNLYRKYVEGRYGAIPKTSIVSLIESYWAEQQSNE